MWRVYSVGGGLDNLKFPTASLKWGSASLQNPLCTHFIWFFLCVWGYFNLFYSLQISPKKLLKTISKTPFGENSRDVFCKQFPAVFG